MPRHKSAEAPLFREGSVTERRGLLNAPREGSGQASGQPSIALVIDELADLLMVGGKSVQHALTRLTQRGREAGIHVVAATQKPTSDVLGPLVKANFPVRLVGKVTSASDARTATGWSGTGAERLLGRGDFLAVAEGRVTRFQAAHVSPEEIQEVVACLVQGEVGSQQMVLQQAQGGALPWPVKRLTDVFRGGEA
jgi:DNA segregation ATPase FtsK/SpoIIIE-like protein